MLSGDSPERLAMRPLSYTRVVGTVTTAVFACVAIVVTVQQLASLHDASDRDDEPISCDPIDRRSVPIADFLCSLWDDKRAANASAVAVATTGQPPADDDDDDGRGDEVRDATRRDAPLFETCVSIFLVCGECAILGASLFGGMVHATPGVGLRASKRASLASLLAVLSAVGYQAVCLGWYLDRLGVLHVVGFAPVCQALLTVAVALLYAAVMDLYTHASDATATARDRLTTPLSRRRARFC